MKLTQKDLDLRIESGIYRFSLNHNDGVPHIRKPKKNFGLVERIEKAKSSDMILNKSEINSKKTVFGTIEEFLNTWSRGYGLEQSQFGTGKREPLGFELFYVNWYEDQEYFDKIPKGGGIKMMGDREDLNSVFILGDNNGMNDQEGYLNLGVSDLRRQKSFVYREYDGDEILPQIVRRLDIDLSQRNLKQMQEIPYYLTGSNEFPLRQPNSLKSINHIWTAIGISPDEIYEAVEKRGFVFPE